jgi:hypothetical protein
MQIAKSLICAGLGAASWRSQQRYGYAPRSQRRVAPAGAWNKEGLFRRSVLTLISAKFERNMHTIQPKPSARRGQYFLRSAHLQGRRRTGFFVDSLSACLRSNPLCHRLE